MKQDGKKDELDRENRSDCSQVSLHFHLLPRLPSVHSSVAIEMALSSSPIRYGGLIQKSSLTRQRAQSVAVSLVIISQ